jgi:hypothetical protein
MCSEHGRRPVAAVTPPPMLRRLRQRHKAFVALGLRHSQPARAGQHKQLDPLTAYLIESAASNQRVQSRAKLPCGRDVVDETQISEHVAQQHPRLARRAMPLRALDRRQHLHIAHRMRKRPQLTLRWSWLGLPATGVLLPLCPLKTCTLSFPGTKERAQRAPAPSRKMDTVIRWHRRFAVRCCRPGGCANTRPVMMIFWSP